MIGKTLIRRSLVRRSLVAQTLLEPRGDAPNELPVAEFSSIVTYLSVAFTDLSTDADGTIVAWDWDWGDGTAHGTTQNPTHVYTTEGTKTVVLTVTDDDGDIDSVSHDVEPTIQSWTMTKTGGVGGSFDAGASSSTSIAGDGYVEMTATGSAGVIRAFGLSVTDPDQHYNTIKFCLFMDATGVLYVFELGVLKFTGTFASNDVLRVVRVGTAITYLKNGALQYTSATAQAGAIIIDTDIRSAGGTIALIKLIDNGVRVPITWTNVVNVTMS